MIVTPPLIPTLSPAPSTSSPANFDAMADAFLPSLAPFGVALNLAGVAAYSNALDASTSATTASASASAASAASTAAGAVLWISGTSYTLGQGAISPANRMLYRRSVAGAGTTDPSLDAANWQLVQGVLPIQVISSNTVAVPGVHYCIAAACTLTMPTSSALNDVIQVTNVSGLTTPIVDFGTVKVRGRIIGADNKVTLDSIDTKFTVQYTGNITYGWA